jgi:hypothetical protein
MAGEIGILKFIGLQYVLTATKGATIRKNKKL